MEALQDIEKLVLQTLDKQGHIADSDLFAGANNLGKEDLEKILKSLLVDDFVQLEVIERKVIELTEEGLGYA